MMKPSEIALQWGIKKGWIKVTEKDGIKYIESICSIDDELSDKYNITLEKMELKTWMEKIDKYYGAEEVFNDKLILKKEK